MRATSTLRGVPPIAPSCEARDVAIIFQNSRAVLFLSQNGNNRNCTRDLDPPTHQKQCKFVRLTPLRSVRHQKERWLTKLRNGTQNSAQTTGPTDLLADQEKDKKTTSMNSSNKLKTRRKSDRKQQTYQKKLDQRKMDTTRRKLHKEFSYENEKKFAYQTSEVCQWCETQR